MRVATLPLALMCVALGGCKLIDQRSFEPRATAPSSGQVARSSQVAATRLVPALPLVSVFPGDLEHDWRPDVAAAVRAALVRRPDAAFDIVTPIPTARGPDAQRAAMLTGSADAAAVAAVMQAEGIPAERLHLGARGDAGNPRRDVLVFVR